MQNIQSILILIAFALVYQVYVAPVRTELCCCGCTTDICPIVGSNCGNPRIACNETKRPDGVIRCSALQRLFEISHSEMLNHFDEIDGDHAPDMDSIGENSPNTELIIGAPGVSALLPERDNSICLNSMHHLHAMITELEGMFGLLKTQVKEAINKSEEQPRLDEVDSQIPVRHVVRRHKRDEAADNCNDDKLRKIIKNNIKKDAKTSKREIQKAANKEFDGSFNVICSPCEFSFVVASQKYCEGFKDDIACFAFLQPSSKKI